LLTGDEGGERTLQDLERANAFVVSVDTGRSWFRYHQMFVDLLQLELRRAAPGEVIGLHQAAAAWLAGHGWPVEAVRNAQAARDWGLAARLLADNWPGLYLDGEAGTIHELLAGFPAGLSTTDAEVALVAAADELEQGSLEAAERYLGRAERGSASVSEARRGHLRLLLGVVRLLLARQRGNRRAVAEEVTRLRAMAEAPDFAKCSLGEDLNALALISLAAAEFWAPTSEDASRHLAHGVALARRAGRPYLEFTALAHQAMAETCRSSTAAAELGREAVELAEQHCWTDDPAFGIACLAVGLTHVWQGRPDEAEPWVQRAERAVQAETQPVAGVVVRYGRGILELERNRDAEALAAFEAAETLARRVSTTHYWAHRVRALLVHTLVRLGQTRRAGQVLAGLSDQDREHREIRLATAELQLADGDPGGAVATLGPVVDGPVPPYSRLWLAMANVLEAMARDALGDPVAAENALERALDVAEPNGDLTPFLLYPAPGLLERHARNRTAHASLVAEIRSMLSGTKPSVGPTGPQPPLEPLSDSELRVLRYLPTNLRAPEVARELYVSPNTVKTHIRNLYAKLGAHRRAEAVESARALGLLAPSGGGRTGLVKAATP
jgi:LuxR family transcriptional regulator, maltose regulon positive regulatory protein